MSASFSQPTAFVASLLEKLQRHPKRVVFPEPDDDRILLAAAELLRLEAVLPVLLGTRGRLAPRLAALGIDSPFMRIIDPVKSGDLPLFCDRYARMERFRGVTVADPAAAMAKPHHFAAMMVQYGQADAIVAGNSVHPSTVQRAIFHLIKPLPGVHAPFAATVLVDDSRAGGERILVLADCALHASPEPETLAEIAVEAGRFARHLLGRPARVAMLSHSTKGHSNNPAALKVAAATALARQLAAERVLDLEIEGELQADVALVPELAAAKQTTSLLKGEADVLVFPDLDAADISLRLLRHLAGFSTYGNFLLGLARPAAQVSRGIQPSCLLGTIAAIAVEAVKHHDLYPEGETGGIVW
jgi:phosphate acetyltransferase